jgi:hypothetical protein
MKTTKLTCAIKNQCEWHSDVFIFMYSMTLIWWYRAVQSQLINFLSHPTRHYNRYYHKNLKCKNHYNVHNISHQWTLSWCIRIKYMLVSRHQNPCQNRDIKTANRSFENVSQSKYVGTTEANQNLIQEEIKRRLNSGNARYHLVQTHLSSRLQLKT